MSIITPYKSSHSIFEQLLAATYMESKLLVKNFGPIKDVNLTLKNVNVFIGPQATGKSALAKLFTIFKAPRKFFYTKEKVGDRRYIIDNNNSAFDEVSNVFREYNIDSFLTNETIIEFTSELHSISYKSGVLSYHAKLYEKATNLRQLTIEYLNNRDKLISAFEKLGEQFIMFKIRANQIINQGREKDVSIQKQWAELTEDKCDEIFSMLEDLEDELSTKTAIYIPAERSIVNIIKKYALNLLINNVPIPKYILNFGAEIEKLNPSEINLDFIHKNLKYRVIDGEDRIYINDEQSIKLTEAASGIQSVVPLLAFTLDIRPTTHRSFVIEEPELNLFPTAQYELLKNLESQRKEYIVEWEDVGTIHTYTTHSPYILSSLNNFLYASKVEDELNNRINRKDISLDTVFAHQRNNQDLVKKVVKATINPSTFTAYQIDNGHAKSIFNHETGLIEDNYIDLATDRINDDFGELMELLNDK
ncbi:MAG: AAA family ATPase [Ferruginibacter sp.]|nr:AAA family ATPase [Ferruginibacter sp.]